MLPPPHWSAYSPPFVQFLTKALTALITAPPKAPPSPYLKPRLMQQNAELPRVLLNSWTDLVYHVAELLVPLLADETKVAHVWLLYTAGLDQTAEEVRICIWHAFLLS